MLRRFVLLVAAAFAAGTAAAAVSRITFHRVLPAPHDLGSGEIAVVHVLGNTERVSAFLEVFLEHSNRPGRRVRETIELAGEAPAFDEGMVMIESGRLSAARRIWEKAKPGNRSSAALHFNLGAVSEATGDIRAAAGYFAEAERLAIHKPQYSSELERFRRRYGRRQAPPVPANATKERP